LRVHNGRTRVGVPADTPTLGLVQRAVDERELPANALEEVEGLVLGDVGAEMNPHALRALQAAGSRTLVLAALQWPGGHA
jgi:hypothetical protein